MEREGTDCLNLLRATPPLLSPLQQHPHHNACPVVICPVSLLFLPLSSSNSAPDTTASSLPPLFWLIVVWFSQSPPPGPGYQAQTILPSPLSPPPLPQSTNDHLTTLPLQRDSDCHLPSIVLACVGLSHHAVANSIALLSGMQTCITSSGGLQWDGK